MPTPAAKAIDPPSAVEMGRSRVDAPLAELTSLRMTTTYGEGQFVESSSLIDEISSFKKQS